MCGRRALGGVVHPGCKTTYGLDGLTSFFHYDGIIKKAIKAIKYTYRFDLVEEFITLVPHRYFDGIVIPIPLHTTRFKERGFNQAEVLGKFFAQKQKLIMVNDVLLRTKKTLPQAEIAHRNDRLKNMQDVFAVSPRASLTHYPSLMLFDDVFTTGATMRSAARVLKQNGAKNVWAITMAR